MKTLIASAIALAVLALGAGGADAHARKKAGYGHKHYASKHVRPQVRGYIRRGGGYAYGYEPDPFLGQSGPHTYPVYDNRTFWERVQSDPRDNRPGVSAF